MDRNFIRVITSCRFEESVPLIDLFDDINWSSGVAGSLLRDHYLSVVCVDKFTQSPKSRVLSYRWKKDSTIQLNCSVTDPAGKVYHINDPIALEFLNAPMTGWEMLWVDALNHLQDTDAKAISLVTMGYLYLNCVCLPLYLFEREESAIEEALHRGWMHQELAYGALDKSAILHIYATLDSCALDFQREEVLNPLFFRRVKFLSVAEQSSLGLAKYIRESFRLWKAKDTNLDAKTKFEEFLNLLCEKQLSDDAMENVSFLERNKIVCWSVILSLGNTNYSEGSDGYFAPLDVLGKACGIIVTDPLAAYKKKFRSDLPHNSDGSLRYSKDDLDLDVINNNNQIMRICWTTILRDGQSMPKSWPGRMQFPLLQSIQLRKSLYGMHTFGIGPFPTARLNGYRGYISRQMGGGPFMLYYENGEMGPNLRAAASDTNGIHLTVEDVRLFRREDFDDPNLLQPII